MLEFCRKTQETLQDGGLRVHLDDRDIRAGKKYYEWEMRGVPIRIEIGPRDIENGTFVVVPRNTKKKEFLDYDLEKITQQIQEKLDEISKEMLEKSWQTMKENINTVESVDEALEILDEDKGIISFSWCGDTSCGKDLEEKLRVDLLGVQGDLEGEAECVNCGAPAKHIALLARTY